MPKSQNFFGAAAMYVNVGKYHQFWMLLPENYEDPAEHGKTILKLILIKQNGRLSGIYPLL
jgi:hypothetical protein